MRDLFCGATIGGHAINVVVIRLKVKPPSIIEIEEVSNSVIAFGQLLGWSAFHTCMNLSVRLPTINAL